MKNKFYIFVILFLFWQLESTKAQDQNTIVVDSHKPIRLKGTQMGFLIDSLHQYHFEAIREEKGAAFVPLAQDVPNLANTTATIWVKMVIQKKIEPDIILEIANPLLDSLDFFTPQPDGSFQKVELGAKKPFAQRLFLLNNFVLPLPFQKQGESQTFYLRIRSEYPIELPIQIQTLQTLAEANQKQDTAMGIYIGFMIVMAIYNFFIFLSVRDKTYLFYIGYVVCLGFLYANFKGYAYHFVWADLPQINYYIPLLVSLTSIFILLFARSFLETYKKYRKISIGIYILIAIFSLLSILNLAGLYAISAPLSQLFSLLMAVFLLVTASYCYLTGLKIARFYLLAWTAFLVGVIAFMLQVMGVLPTTPFTQNAALFGSALEVVLLSFALADRINAYKKQKEMAQKEALAKKEENERLIREQNQLLEQKVNEATEELKMANEELNSTNEELNANLETIQQQHLIIAERSDELTALNEELHSTNEELNATVEMVKKQNNLIEEKNRHITDSLRYARTIQNAILPFEERMELYLKEYFVFYRPKDIVSGDFYWISDLKGKVYLAVADCTGHGVPGAFTSMIGSAALDALIDRNELENPAEILEALHQIIRKSLKQDNNANADGMDIALCVLEYLPEEKCKVAFAGARRPLRYFKAQEQKLYEIKGTNRSIGGYSRKKETRPFEYEEIILEKDDVFYINSDGFADQNNAQDDKFGSHRLKRLYQEIGALPLPLQKQKIEAAFEAHIGNEPQRDDITLLAVKIK
ncbi:7TM diverse intracellular signaling domain-containing protein [Hugenholtzia roseola]|uniref:7TM diverse intracellular signaling domain-containing protein n=1 Tax=Hugenholtzia roseola TaxID=1002 RepID=UPI00040F017F|nr:7TM diverse intracellular signaling domain-containing protein [Hugenholtzia roseola]